MRPLNLPLAQPWEFFQECCPLFHFTLHLQWQWPLSLGEIKKERKIEIIDKKNET
jgi:hypothetical protein